MTYKLLAQDEFGKTALVDPSTLSGSPNVVLSNIDCLSSVYVGAAVIINGGVVSNALANSMVQSNIIGIVEEKLSLNKCNVRVSGVTGGSIFSGLDETKEYFLSASVAGQITETPPSNSGDIMLKVGQPFDSSNFLVLKGQRTVRL